MREKVEHGPNIGVLLAHSDHDTLVARATDDRPSFGELLAHLKPEIELTGKLRGEHRHLNKTVIQQQ